MAGMPAAGVPSPSVWYPTRLAVAAATAGALVGAAGLALASAFSAGGAPRLVPTARVAAAGHDGMLHPAGHVGMLHPAGHQQPTSPDAPPDAATVQFVGALAKDRVRATPPLPLPELFKRHDGYFTLYMGVGLATGRVMLAVPEAVLGRPFLITALVAAGDAEVSLAAVPANTFAKNVFAFRKSEGYEDALDLYRPLFDLRAEQPDSQMRTSLEEGYFAGWVRSFGVRRDGSSKAYLLDATTWIQSGLDVMTDNDGRAPPFSWEQSHRITGGAAYPRNLELDVQVRVRNPDVLGTSVLSPENYFARRTHYSIVALPEQPMVTRPADTRIGFFGTTYMSADDESGGRLKRTLVNRWDLSKRDIVYYVDPTVPARWRGTVKRGVEEWNVAFAAAGHPGVVRAVLPGDADWPADYAAGDARYSSISWAPNLGSAYALGPSDADPRTGEILNGDIMLASNFVQAIARDFARGPFGPGAAVPAAHPLAASEEVQEHVDGVLLLRALRSADGVNETDPMARAAVGWSDEFGLGAMPMPGTGGDAALAEVLEQGLKELVMHEIGHTLGLRHNFRASAAIPFSKLSDKAFVAANGLSSSVMDYLPFFVRADPADQAFYSSPTVGRYDVAAIRYGYATFSSDNERLAFAQQVVENGLDFSTDDDAPGVDGADPLSSYWDMSATPLDFHDESLLVARKVLRVAKAATLRKAAASWLDFSAAATTALRRATNNLAYASKFLGGTVPSRAASTGGPAGTPPVSTVDVATQKRALGLILRELNPRDGLLGSAVAREYGPFLVTRLCYGGGSGAPTDQCLGVGGAEVITYMRTLRQRVFDALLQPARLARMTEGQVVGGGGRRGAPSVSELLRHVTGTLFGGGRSVDDLQRDAQAQWVGTLLYQVKNHDELGAHPLAVSAMAGELTRIHAKVTDKDDAHLTGLSALLRDFAA